MDALSIVKEWLTVNGYSGLFQPGEECACSLDDLMPCMDFGRDCEPGYREACDPATCTEGGGCEFHINPKKPAKGAPVDEQGAGGPSVPPEAAEGT